MGDTCLGKEKRFLGTESGWEVSYRYVENFPGATEEVWQDIGEHCPGWC